MVRDKAMQVIKELRKKLIDNKKASSRLRNCFNKKLVNEADFISNRGKRIDKLIFLHESKCFFCGRNTLKNHKTSNNYYHTATVDHIIPLSKGGLDHIENCILSCSQCNHKKGNNLTPEGDKYFVRKATNKEKIIKKHQERSLKQIIELEDKERFYLEKYRL